MVRLLARLLVLLALVSAVPARAQLDAPQTFGGTAGGTANALTLTVPNVGALADLVGVPIRFFPASNNAAGTVSLAVSGLAATNLSKGSPAGETQQFAAGDLVAGQLYIATLTAAAGVFHIDLPAASRASINIRDCGAKVDGSSDDTAAINACEALVAPGGTVVFPTGVACTYTGLSYADNGMRFQGEGHPGAGQTGSVISACSHNVTTLTLGGFGDHLSNLKIQGPGMQGGGTAPTGDALVITGVGTVVEYSVLVQGRFPLNIATVDYVIFASSAANSYGGANIYHGCNSGPVCPTTAGGLDSNGYMIRVSADQNNVGSCGLPTISPAWAATTGYANCAAVNLPGASNFVLQNIGACTSGSSTPVAASYGVNISDGTCTWQTLFAKNLSVNTADASCALAFDYGSFISFVELSDFSGATEHAICLYNTLNSGNTPQLINLIGNDTTSFGDALEINAGVQVVGIDNYFGYCSFTGSGAGVNVNGTFIGDLQLDSNLMTLCAQGASLGAGKDESLIGNKIYDNSVNGVAVGNSLSNFSLTTNHFTSASGGTNAGTNILIGTGVTKGVIADNVMTSGTIINNSSGGSGLFIVNNPGYNPVGAANLSPSASPWSYTAGSSPESIHMTSSTGGVSSVTINAGSNLIPSGSPLNVSIELGPGDAMVTTYGGTLTATSMRH